MSVPLRLHHVGVVVADLETAAADYMARLGYERRTGVIHDEEQTAYVTFLRLPGDAVYLELVSPDGPDSKLSNSLRRGGGLNHVCYETEDIDAACADMRRNGFALIQAPIRAVAFGERRIAWLMNRDRLLTELVERRGESDDQGV